MVRLFLSWGADPTLSTYSGRTALKIARTKQMRDFLLAYFVDLNGAFHMDTERRWELPLETRGKLVVLTREVNNIMKNLLRGKGGGAESSDYLGSAALRRHGVDVQATSGSAANNNTNISDLCRTLRNP